ncbi:MAG: hypothetical protein M1833_000760 [Piccolia ochrophora]|nr:MAG: hypothetical protein M1833_000760 [Piccolia ochrophora]
MKLYAVAAALAVGGALASEQADDTVCPQPDGNFCAGESMTTDTIIRCKGGQPVKSSCKEGLAYVEPQGPKEAAKCWQTSVADGDGACSYEHFVYPEGEGKEKFEIDDEGRKKDCPESTTTPHCPGDCPEPTPAPEPCHEGCEHPPTTTSTTTSCPPEEVIVTTSVYVCQTAPCQGQTITITPTITVTPTPAPPNVVVCVGEHCPPPEAQVPPPVEQQPPVVPGQPPYLPPAPVDQPPVVPGQPPYQPAAPVDQPPVSPEVPPYQPPVGGDQPPVPGNELFAPPADMPDVPSSPVGEQPYVPSSPEGELPYVPASPAGDQPGTAPPLPSDCPDGALYCPPPPVPGYESPIIPADNTTFGNITAPLEYIPEDGAATNTVGTAVAIVAAAMALYML